VSFAGAIERAGIGWSGRAYWASTERQNLNHLLTNEKQPRSVWWAYERYARLNGRLARVTRGVTADGVAARDDGAKALRVVVGRTTGTTETFDITFSNLDSVPFVNQASRFEITVERIPHSGDAALAEPALVREEEVTLSNGSLVVQVPELGSLDAAYVELRAIGSLPDGGWPDGTGGTSGGTGAGSGGQAGSAGTGGAVSGGGQSNGGQQSGMAGAGGDTPGASGDDGGCACRAASSPAHGASLGLLTVLLVALRRRRASKA
jgi:MYXO-CTERM domain-containing protein